MSRLDIKTPSKAQMVVEHLYRSMEHRIEASPPGLCPVDMALNFLNLCHAQTCGKCVPCRVGLGQLSHLLQRGAGRRGHPGDILQLIEDTAQVIVDTADCAIGIEAAQLVLMGLQGFRDDYEEHILHHRCLGSLKNPVPCVALCPAGVDIPGYIALVGEGRYADAVRLIRKDNPFPTACAYICEHPCEARCRRNMVDDAINIRGLKRFAVDHAGDGAAARPAPQPTGKTVAIVGGGPGGLSAAYYLALMGHQVTVYEQRKQLGGMLRYGIPSYRLPREQLDAGDRLHPLHWALRSTPSVDVGKDITFEELQKQYDCLYISIGAHTDKKTGIPGRGQPGRHLRRGDAAAHRRRRPCPTSPASSVVVIGGGNVAMDVHPQRHPPGRREGHLRLPPPAGGYDRPAGGGGGRRGRGRGAADPPGPRAHREPTRTATPCALWTQPQIIGARWTAPAGPGPSDADRPERPHPGGHHHRGHRPGHRDPRLRAGRRPDPAGRRIAGRTSGSHLQNMEGVFAGGDCVTGPATVIRAIAAGKVAAANIDEYLGFRHTIERGRADPQRRTYRTCAPRGRVEHHGAGGRRAQAGLPVHRVRHDPGGGHAGVRPLPAVRPLRLRRLQEEDVMEKW